MRNVLNGSQYRGFKMTMVADNYLKTLLNKIDLVSYLLHESQRKVREGSEGVAPSCSGGDEGRVESVIHRCSVQVVAPNICCQVCPRLVLALSPATSVCEEPETCIRTNISCNKFFLFIICFLYSFTIHTCQASNKCVPLLSVG